MARRRMDPLEIHLDDSESQTPPIEKFAKIEQVGLLSLAVNYKSTGFQGEPNSIFENSLRYFQKEGDYSQKALMSP